MKAREKGRRRSGRRYAEIATGAKGGAGHPDPVAHATSVGYAEEELKTVPADAVMSLGCGNPVARARLRQGEIVLDFDEVWGEWLTMAQSKNDYLRAIEQAGFQTVAVEEEATFPMAENDERLKGRIVSIGVTSWKE